MARYDHYFKFNTTTKIRPRAAFQLFGSSYHQFFARLAISGLLSLSSRPPILPHFVRAKADLIKILRKEYERFTPDERQGLMKRFMKTQEMVEHSTSGADQFLGLAYTTIGTFANTEDFIAAANAAYREINGGQESSRLNLGSSRER